MGFYKYTHKLNKKRIVFITGTRADFGKLKTLINSSIKSKKFDVHIFATGMHVRSSYGYSVYEIEKSGFSNIHKFINHTGTDRSETILANTIQGLGNYFQEYKPDLVVVHGDRIEALAGALAGSLNNTLVAHIEGGELSGNIDEHIRHAVSKMSHFHFVSNQEARRRLLQMGETENSIFVIGSPDVDVMVSKDLPSLQAVKKRYGIKFDKYAILIYHPVTSELDTVEHQGLELTSALLESKVNYVVIHPNNDPGTDIIKGIYNNKLAGHNRFKMFESIRFENFLTLLKNAEFMIGNSSAGVREAPYYGVPSIDIGTRQLNRVKNVKSIFNIDCNKEKILELINRLSSRKQIFKPVQKFGTGDSHIKFTKVLTDNNIWDRKIQKQFKDLSLL